MRHIEAISKTMAMALALCAASACTGQASTAVDSDTGEPITLRNLTESDVAVTAQENYVVQGRLISTPSDKDGQFYLLHHRRPTFSDTIVAVLREERGNRAAYARVEIDCGRRLFHILGVANRRSFVETSRRHDGPLRSMEGLPLRQEIAAHICASNGTPLAAA